MKFGDDMNFDTFDELRLWTSLNRGLNFAGGSQGECFRIGKKVYKIFLQYIDDDYFRECSFSREDIMRFSQIKNDTYVWPINVITVGDLVVGYVMNYVRAKSLFKIDPRLISLNRFDSSIDKVLNDVKVISANGVSTYDVCYNILYGLNGFKIVDTMEYSSSSKDYNSLVKHNNEMFSYEVKMFLVDGYFDKLIADSKLLSEMYQSNDVNALIFLREFRKRLSEIEGKDILRLGEANKGVYSRRKSIPCYVREI